MATFTNKGRPKTYFCIFCNELLLKERMHQHIHNLRHHIAQESELGDIQGHDCHACQVVSMELNEYAQHITGTQHKTNLENLCQSKVKFISLYKTLTPDAARFIRQKKRAQKQKRKYEQMQKNQQNAFADNRDNKASERRAGQKKQAGQLPPSGQQQNKDNNQLADQHLTAKKKLSQHSSPTGGATQQPTMDHLSNYPYRREELADFTSDRLPVHGSTIFTQDERCAPSEPKRSATASNSQPKPAPIQDMGVGNMLREIRRALDMREPCKADQEARKQNAEAPETLERNEDAPDGGHNTTPWYSVTDEPNTPAGSSTGIQPDSKTKVRLAHKVADAQTSGQDGVRKGSPKPTSTTPASIEHTSKKNWRLMFSETKSRQKMNEGTPRYGIDLATALNKQTPFDLGVNEDLILSEGFHWESLSNAHAAPPPFLLSPSPPCLLSTPRPPSNDTTASPGESPSTPRVPDDGASLQPGKVCGPTVASTSAKAEPENENSSANKRKQLQENGVHEMEAVVKRRKMKSNNDQDPMDKLLTVSLREEELSQSLQNLDKSLVLARNVLQAAYTDLQRLVLLRRQCTAEVDSLRAERIEILQNMQEVYAANSNMEQDPTTSTAASTDHILSSRSSPNILPPPPTHTRRSPEPTPSTSQPHATSPATTPTIATIKQEAAIPPPSRQPSPQVRPLSSPRPPLSSPATAEDPNPSNQERIERFSKKNIGIDTKVETKEEDLAIEAVTGNDVKPLVRGGINTSAVTNVKVDEDADLVEVMQPKSVVINIDESENEDSPDTSSKEPSPQGFPPKGAGVECNTSSTQTSQRNPFKMKTASISVEFEREAASPPVIGEEEEGEDDPALGAFTGHMGPVHGLQVHDGFLYTCSGDNTARVYSLATRECQGVFKGHTNKINCLLVSSSPNMPVRLFTGSSDQSVRVYSIKSKKCVEAISLPARVLCLHIAWKTLYVGLANGSVATCDVKTLKPLDVFECHGPRGVSCLGTSQEGARRVLLVGSYDSTISVRDARNGLLLRSLEGHTKTVLCMKVVKEMVFSGSSDTSIHAHNIHTGQLMQIFKGHGQAVTSIVILGNVMVTSCLDKLVRVYELKTHDRLQVYGGHNDMVMCMAVHKSVIYTGCYDGTVQAVKLNLMKNYRCWWQNCCLIFGMTEHLLQHLVRRHTNPNLETVTCRWKGCRAFFATQKAVREEFPDHMQTHVDVENKVES
ncbi:zinc finger protein 106-like isoform X2 [Vanacampus margaritifer]